MSKAKKSEVTDASGGVTAVIYLRVSTKDQAKRGGEDVVHKVDRFARNHEEAVMLNMELRRHGAWARPTCGLCQAPVMGSLEPPTCGL